MPVRENMLLARKWNFHFARKIGVICVMFWRTYDAWYQMRAEKWDFRCLRCIQFGSFTWFILCYLWSDKSYVLSEMPEASDNWGHNTNLLKKMEPYRPILNRNSWLIFPWMKIRLVIILPLIMRLIFINKMHITRTLNWVIDSVVFILQTEHMLPFRYMMTSSNGNIFRVTGHLCGKFTGPRWIPRTKASDAELWCFLSSAS